MSAGTLWQECRTLGIQLVPINGLRLRQCIEFILSFYRIKDAKAHAANR